MVVVCAAAAAPANTLTTAEVIDVDELCVVRPGLGCKREEKKECEYK